MRAAAARDIGAWATAVLLAANAGAGPTLNYQGRLAAQGGDFTGWAQFKFVLYNEQNDALWSNDDTPGLGKPASAVPVTS